MERLTLRQEEYLLFFASRDGQLKSISEAAEQFHVSKPSVFKVSEALEAQGMIVRGMMGEITLTEEGWEYISPKFEQQRTLTEWLEISLGLEPLAAERESRRIIVSLEIETVEGLVRDWLQRRPEPKANGTDFKISSFPVGIYQVDFSVYKKERAELSMGDRGFWKPAILLREERKSTFLLYPRQIWYQPRNRKRMKGILDRLWYQKAGAWYETQRGERGSCLIPGSAVRCVESDDGLCGVLRIYARASVGMLGMPDSQADLVFFLGKTKRLSGWQNGDMEKADEKEES